MGTGEPSDASSLGSGAPHVRAVKPGSGPTRTLATNHVADLASSGLTPETMALSGVYSEAQSKLIAKLLGWSWRNGAALVFPFLDYDSRRLLLCRVKPDSPRLRGPKDKTVKYEQPKNTGAVPYFGPRCLREHWLEREATIYWVEGEKKTLCLDQLGYAAIGITGCHVWNDGAAHRAGDGMVWGKAFRKYAERFIATKRHVLVFDSDSATNKDVMLALQRLAGLLLQDGAISTWFVRIPPDKKYPKRGIGIDDYYVEHGEQATRDLITAAERVAIGETVQPIAPKDPLLKLCKLSWLKDANLDRDLRLPPRFDIRRDHSLWLDAPLEKVDAPPKEVMRAALLPTALLQSVDDDEQRIEVAYYARGHWRRSVVDRRALRDARRALIELPPAVAIDSNNAALVVGWLSEFMRHNEHRLELRRYVGKHGWQTLEGGARCFLLDAPIVSAAEADSGRVSIVADESGDRGEMLAALRPQGTLSGHKAALARAFNEDKVCALMILAALAAPLLKPLGAPNFALHLFGDSSRGKTSKLVCGASVYGNPGSEQWVGSWNATTTAMELRAMTLCDLPLLFDEVGAGDKGALERALYMLVNGSGRSRAQRSLQLRKTPSWRTIVCSTGEHLLATEVANTGAQVRVLQHRVSGFGGLDAAGVDEIREACASHSGHVGRVWLQHLVEIDDWQPYRDVYRTAKDQFRSKEDGTLMQRQAVFYALLALAEHMAHDFGLGFGCQGGGTVRELFVDTDTRRDIRSAGERAIDSVSGWIAREPHSFPSLTFNTSGGLIARVKQNVQKINGVRHRDQIYFIPDALRWHLEHAGLSFSEVIASWKDLGCLSCDKKRKLKRVRWDGNRVWVVSVSSEAFGLHKQTELQGEFGDTEDDFS